MISKSALDVQDRVLERAERKAFGEKPKDRFYARSFMSHVALRLFTDTKKERDDFTKDTNEAVLRRLLAKGNVTAEIYTIVSKDGSREPSEDTVLITSRDGIATNIKPEYFDTATEERTIRLSTDDIARIDSESQLAD